MNLETEDNRIVEEMEGMETTAAELEQKLKGAKYSNIYYNLACSSNRTLTNSSLNSLWGQGTRSSKCSCS